MEGWRRQGLEALAGRGLLEAAAWEQQRRQEVEAGLAAETARAAGLEEALAAAERRAEWRAQLEQCRAGVVRRRSFAFVPVVPLAEGDGREWDGREAERDDDPQLQHALLMEQMQRDRQMLAEDAAQHADSRECRQRQELELFGLKAGPGDGGYGEAEEYEGVASASPASVRSECDEETWAAFYGLVQRCFDANHDGHIDVAGMRSFLSAVGAGETDAFHSAGWAESWAAICGSLGYGARAPARELLGVLRALPPRPAVGGHAGAPGPPGRGQHPAARGRRPEQRGPACERALRQPRAAVPVAARRPGGGGAVGVGQGQGGVGRADGPGPPGAFKRP